MGDRRWLDQEQQRAWRSFLTATTLLFARIDDDLKPFDLSGSEYAILVRLNEAPGRQLRMAQIADALCHSRSRITHTVKRMELKGLVTRADSSDDGRGVVAVLTDAGAQKLAEAAPGHVATVRKNLFDLGSPDDIAALTRVMDAIADELGYTHPETDLR
jgi:DNA-binding MarR family transcriptional regulator